MKENLYRVWVGGVIDAENVTLSDAQIIEIEWKNQGYNDVIIEKQKNENNDRESIAKPC